ncbi:hypothetical protein AB4Z52_05300 [Rhizobium sp. 2YAF20]|uniref:hypothetical protein n=1 Tax=Rhizobium sp. 2YAF20 TaxID=3233027 RepID=UPI003F9E2704
MIAGREDITDGEIAIDNEVINDASAKERDIAMVFQYCALYPHMTVAQNMGSALQVKRCPATDFAARVSCASSILGLDKLGVWLC